MGQGYIKGQAGGGSKVHVFTGTKTGGTVVVSGVTINPSKIYLLLTGPSSYYYGQNDIVSIVFEGSATGHTTYFYALSGQVLYGTASFTLSAGTLTISSSVGSFGSGIYKVICIEE